MFLIVTLQSKAKQGLYGDALHNTGQFWFAQQSKPKSKKKCCAMTLKLLKGIFCY